MIAEPPEELARGYIRSKTERLLATKTRLEWATVSVVLLDMLFLLLPSWGLPECLAFAFLAIVAAGAWRSICDLHIDQLSTLKRDLDRDLALDLIGFETRP